MCCQTSASDSLQSHDRDHEKHPPLKGEKKKEGSRTLIHITAPLQEHGQSVSRLKQYTCRRVASPDGLMPLSLAILLNLFCNILMPGFARDVHRRLPVVA